MATRAATFTRNVSPRGGAELVAWTGLLNGDDGAPINMCEYGEKSAQVIGTLGVAGAVQIEGSNDGGTTWAALNTKQGAAMLLVALGFSSTQDRPVLVRPRVTAGDGTTSLTVAVALHRSDFSAVV